MTRRFVQIAGELVEVGQSYDPAPRSDARASDSVLWNDRAYQDANDSRFRSRTEHREYMKRHGLTTVDDFKQHFAKAEQQRAEVLQGRDASRRDDIARAFARRQR